MSLKLIMHCQAWLKLLTSLCSGMARVVYACLARFRLLSVHRKQAGQSPAGLHPFVVSSWPKDAHNAPAYLFFFFLVAKVN